MQQLLRRSLLFIFGQRRAWFSVVSLMFLALIVMGLPALSGAQQTCQPDGDVDQNGSVTAADALLVFQQALGSTELSACQRVIADVFPQPSAPDGAITASDALCIFQNALGSPSCLDSVSPPNEAPAVNAGPDQSVDAGLIVVLSGTSSDPDGGIVSYRWEQTGGTVVSLAGADSLTAMFTAPDVSVDETLTFQLTVTDDDGAQASDEVSVTVRRINLPPFVFAGLNPVVDAGVIVVLYGEAFDMDGGIVGYMWEQTGGTTVSLAGADSLTAMFTATRCLGGRDTDIPAYRYRRRRCRGACYGFRYGCGHPPQSRHHLRDSEHRRRICFGQRYQGCI